VSLDDLGRHASHPFFGVRDDCLILGNRSVLEIAAQAGRTPFYAYVRQYMTDRVAQLRVILPRELKLHYAIKANPMPAVVAHMAGLVDGLDVASGTEMQIALNTGLDPASVSLAGPGKTDAELERAASAGITINVESEREIRVLGRIGIATGRRPRVAIRVNPAFELKTSGMKMGGGPKQFGIDSERVPDALAEIATLSLEFQGFHIFTGSQNLRAEAIIDAQQHSVELAVELARHAPGPVRTLNLGGGFGIPYFPGDRPLDLAPVAENLRRLIPEIRRHMPNAELILELGRYLVGESGVYVCRVIDRKISRGQVFLITDGGLHHHLAASGNFGQVIRKNYPVVVANHIRGMRRETVSVVGPLCTPLDLLAERTDLAAAEVGDLVAVLQSGAYGLTASPLGFLSHPPPVEVLI
jgi:diaminopimelate decarboxylase